MKYIFFFHFIILNFNFLVLLFRWYDPLSRFVWLKRVELDKLSTPYTGPQHPHKPFNLIFGSMATNSDYPMVGLLDHFF